MVQRDGVFWPMAELDFQPRQTGFSASEAGKPKAGPPKTPTWQTYLVAFRERQTFSLCRKLPVLFPRASNLSVWTMRDVFEAGVWGRLEALNIFSPPCTHWHPAPCHPGPLPCVPETKVCLWGREGGVDRMFRSETMSHNTEGFLLANSHFSPVTSTSLIPILNATLLLFYWIGAAFSEMGDLFL